MAEIADSVMLSGVAKSGSPISRCTIFLPAASRPRARARISKAPSVPRRCIRSANRIPIASVNASERAAVDSNRLPGHVGSLSRAEERADCPELGRIADTAGRDAPGDILQAAAVELIYAIGQDRTRRQVVDSDAGGGHLG